MFVIANINPDTGQPFVIRQPERLYRVLPDEGAEVQSTRFYRQHIKDNALRVVEPVVAHVAIVVKTGATA
jgi:hypothetical protein